MDGRRITIDPAEYFFRFESNTWLVADWELVKAQLLDVDETTESAVEQLALDFIKNHGESTSDAACVLATAYGVYSYLFREEHLAALGLPQITADHLRMLREAATLMALNKVELDGHISNVGPSTVSCPSPRSASPRTSSRCPTGSGSASGSSPTVSRRARPGSPPPCANRRPTVT